MPFLLVELSFRRTYEPVPTKFFPIKWASPDHQEGEGFHPAKAFGRNWTNPSTWILHLTNGDHTS